MKYQPINLLSKFSKFTEQWSPKIVAQLNNYHFKVARIEGNFTWHDHKNTDEVFLVLEGEMRIDFRDGNVILKKGEMFVVPKSIEHKPFAGKECKILLVEPTGTMNTGDAGGDQTAKNDVWI